MPSTKESIMRAINCGFEVRIWSVEGIIRIQLFHQTERKLVNRGITAGEMEISTIDVIGTNIAHMVSNFDRDAVHVYWP